MVKNQRLWAALFILPAVVVFLMFYAIPLVTVVFTSFTNWKLLNPLEFIGLNNYVKLFNDAVFIKSFTNTIKWVLVVSTLFVLLGVVVALVTIKESKFSLFTRKVYLIPNMLAVAIVSKMFFAMFNVEYGIINQLIRAMSFKDFNKNWYFEMDSSFWSVALPAVLFAGVITLMVSAEIAAIPKDVFESAKIDGASDYQSNRFIVLPMLKNIIATSLIFSVTSVLKTFELILLTTEGGPGYETMNLSYLLYKKATVEYHYGYANAIGVILIILGIISIAIISKASKFGEEAHY